MSHLPAVERQHLKTAFDLHNALAAPGENFCFSPYSIASALGITAKATRGRAADELVQLLAGTESDMTAQAELLSKATILSGATRGENPELAVTNTLWVAEGFPLNPDFRGEVAAWPGGDVKAAPFIDEPEAARQLINDDVAHTTRDLIRELIPAGAVDQNTVASIVNALYLKASWLTPFSENSTIMADFRGSSGDRAVATMRNTERFGYARHQGWQLVDLAAAGGLQALILLPDSDLRDSESQVDDQLIEGLLSAKEDTLLDLSIPKCTLNVRSNLNDSLARLGVRTMFSPRADFSGLSPDPRMYVSDAVHQAVLEVDENGFLGAAATAIMIRLVSMPIGDPVVVRVDRPFLLLVRHEESGAVYFIARVVMP